MDSAATADTAAQSLPLGVWAVDPQQSSLEFSARGMFGLVMVRGSFGDFEGELQVGEAGAKGELRIMSASLDTGNTKRDTHLRSSDFFDVDQSPIVTFSLDSLGAGTGGALTFSGSLKIRQNSLRISAPLEHSMPAEDRLLLGTSVDVDRASAGVGWSRMGMIRGAAHLQAKLTLEHRAQ